MAQAPFYVGVSVDGQTYVPAYGTEITAGTIRVLSETRLAADAVRIRIMLGGRSFVVSATKESDAQAVRQGRTWWNTALAFSRLDDADKAFLERYLGGRRERVPKVERAAKVDAPSGEDLRLWPRKRKPFYLAFSINGIVFIPGYGLDISRSGVRLLTEGQLAEQEFQARIMLHGNDFLVTAQKVWESPAPNDAKRRWMTGSRYTKIDTEHRSFLELYVQDKPYFGNNKLLQALAELRSRPDNADRILPHDTLRLFLDRLVTMGRLAPVKEREQPLVSYRYQGTRTRRGADMHVLQIRSKIVKKDVPVVFTTRFAFDDTASVIDVID